VIPIPTDPLVWLAGASLVLATGTARPAIRVGYRLAEYVDTEVLR